MSSKEVSYVSLLTPREAAKSLAISPRKLWALTSSGDIPHVRIGRSVRYRVETLNEFLSQREQGGAQ
jgi:excisionase family DNA binding protein